jgi:hypothetical protein
MVRTRIGMTEAEESRTEASQVRLPISLGHIRVHLREQTNQELVVPLGPRNPETHAAEPEENLFHVQLFNGLTTRKYGTIREDKKDLPPLGRGGSGGDLR